VPGVDLVETPEVFNVSIEDRRLDHVLHRRSGGSENSGEVQQRLLGPASIPSAIAPVAGSMPAIPEQKTKPPATIAWL
jgi:hypothetical protein